MAEWKLVPVRPTREMVIDMYSKRMDWQRALAATPPMPRSVFDAMVERAAAAMARDYVGHTGSFHNDYWYSEGQRRKWRSAAAAALRAALPGLVIEGEQEGGR